MPPHRTGLGLGLGWPPFTLAEAEDNLTAGENIPYSLLTKPYLIETPSFFAGTSK